MFETSGHLILSFLLIDKIFSCALVLFSSKLLALKEYKIYFLCLYVLVKILLNILERRE